MSAAAAPAAAAPELEADPRWWRAARLAEEGRCPTALPLLDEVLIEHPSDGQALFLRGRCLLRLRRYPDAADTLDRARAAAPEKSEIYLPLAMARYHAGDLEGAEAALSVAEAAEPDRPEVQLYRGLLLLHLGESERAAAALQRTRSADTDHLDPIASYYEARALAASRDDAEAEALLRQVIEDHPDTPWAARAEEALDTLGGPRLNRWGWASVGWEYDDNVVLRGAGVVLPNEISGQRDTRVVWTAGGGVEAALPRGFYWGALVSYEGAAHKELSDFDYDFPSLSTWLDYRVARDTTLRGQADFGYAWVGNEPYLGFYRWGGSLLRGFETWGTTVVGAYWARYDYHFGTEDVPDGPGSPFAACLDPGDIVCAPPGIDEERERRRDGDALEFGIDHTFPLPLPRVLGQWSLQAGYRFQHFDATGSEYSHNAHELLAALRASLPGGLRLTAAGAYVDRPYRNPSTFPNPNVLFFNRQYPLTRERREDHDWRVEISLERDFARWFTLAARWTYRRNRSNVDVFSYERNILGVTLTVALGD